MACFSPRPYPSYSSSSFFAGCSRGLVRCCAERQSLFNCVAPIYDNLMDVLSLGQHRTWKRMCISWSRAKKGDRVLDLCCGSGDLAFVLSQIVGPNGQVKALDFSRDFLTVGSIRQDLHWKNCYKNIEWIEGDALNLPFVDNCFDAITMGYGLRNLTDRRKSLEEIFRVLKPGSRVSILDINKSASSLFQGWMIDNVVVLGASMYGLSEEYGYLKSSIADFLTGRELEELAEEVGFSDCTHYEFGGGLTGNLVAMHPLNKTSFNNGFILF